VYLADSVIPMLPEKLSNVVCSLRPEEDRLTYSVMVTFDARGTISDYEIRKSIIHSKRRFTYEEVQKIIAAGKGEHAGVIARMHALSQSLHKKRMAAGGIDFESREMKFRFDDKGRPTEIIKKDRLDAHRLVEEFMLLANRIVAEHIGGQHGKEADNARPFLYRVHDQPPPEKLRDFVSFVEHLGYTLNISRGVTPRALQKLLADVKGKDEESVINEIAIRTMAKAIYSDANAGHFGLGFDYYTHFTSPIRRYPDLVVHRMLAEYGGKMTLKRRDHYRELLPDVCSHSSARERVAMEAERASVKVMQVEYMKRHVGEEFHAIISGVMKFGLFVEITDLLVEGLIHIRDLEDDYYVLDEKRYQLVGKRTKRRFRLGDKVTIRVVRVDPEEREIDFALAD
jgi:ribonuclease R